MPEAQHYCADCDTHFGGSPNYISPEKHLEVEHPDKDNFHGVKNGDWKDWRDFLEG